MTQKDDPLIIVRELQYTYPDGTHALAGVDLDINAGEYVGIIGQNGSGKTTLVKHFNGLLKPTKGKVLVDHLDTKQASVAQLSTKAGYVFQNPDHQMCCETVQKEVAFGLRNLGTPNDEIEKRVASAMSSVGIVEFKDKHPFFLSKGERHRVAIASVIAMQPRVLIIDEPTTGQDRGRSTQIMDLMTEFNGEGYTIIVISHEMRLIAEYTKRVIVMSRGRILTDGPTRTVFSRTDILKQSYLQPPQITRLAQMLNDHKFPRDALTIEEVYAAFRHAYSET